MGILELNWIINGALIGLVIYLGYQIIQTEKEKVRKQPKFANIESFISSELELLLNNKDLSSSKKQVLSEMIVLLKKYKLKDMISFINSKENPQGLDKEHIIEAIDLIDNEIIHSNK